MIKFLILGNNNAITYKEVFPHIKKNEMWLGFSANKTFKFKLSDSYEKWDEIDEQGNKYCKVTAITWFTNIPHNKNQEPLVLTKTYNPIDYPKYDNYDAIEVSKTKDIPIDYDGVMGVPITFLDKYCNSQFEIVGLCADKRYDYAGCIKAKETYVNEEHKKYMGFVVDGKPTYARILIKKNAEFEIVGCADADIVPNGWKGATEEFVELYYKQGNTGNYKEGNRLAHYIDNNGMAKVPYKRILIKKNAEFEIVWTTDRGGDGKLEHLKNNDWKGLWDSAFVNGSKVYKRILIKRKNKRELGQFYTPKLFVDYAHKMMCEQFGEDWKDKYVVWDNCCGTKNLTRDYHFGELYCSTLEQGELEISTQYNKEATSFQFDFLNDSLDKLPQGLKYAFAYNKPIIFLINPPYATANNMQQGTSKKGCAKTMVNQQMLDEKIGACSQNLYAQFLYRIMKIKEQYGLTNCHIALFCKPNYLSGSTYKQFRNVFFDNFTYCDGVLFNASEFSNVSDKWGINFTIWNSGKQTEKNDFVHKLISNENGEIVVLGSKNIYNIDGDKSASDWIKEDIKGIKTQDAPQLSSALVCKQQGRGKLVDGALGYYVNVANNVYKNQTDVYFVSSCSSMANGISVMPQNFERVMANFASRKLIVGNWINDKDEYLVPNESNEHYQEFVNDSIIYSLFNSASNQSSLRGVEYKGKKWDIKNEFFFMGKDEIMELADEDGMEDCYNDCKASSERYVYGLLKDIELSAEAQAVLDKARELTIKSFKYRKLFNEEHSEYQIMNWDCGWYQIKAVVKEYMPNEYKEFDEAYKKLADKMRPMVYKLGFLK